MFLLHVLEFLCSSLYKCRCPIIGDCEDLFSVSLGGFVSVNDNIYHGWRPACLVFLAFLEIFEKLEYSTGLAIEELVGYLSHACLVVDPVIPQSRVPEPMQMPLEASFHVLS